MKFKRQSASKSFVGRKDFLPGADGAAGMGTAGTTAGTAGTAATSGTKVRFTVNDTPPVRVHT